MLSTIFDNIIFEAKGKVKLKSKIKTHILEKYESYENYFDGNKCYYSNRYSKITMDLSDDLLVKFDYYRNIPYRCGDKSCHCSTLNSVSKEYLKNCRGMTETEATEMLNAKGRKSYKTALLDTNSKNPHAMSARGINILSKDYLGLTRTPQEVEKYLTEKAIRGRKTLKATGWFDDPTNNPFSKGFWMKKGMTDDEALLKINSRNFWCTEFYDLNPNSTLTNPGNIQYWVSLYGEELGRKMYADLKSRIKHSNTLEGRQEKYGMEIGLEKHAQFLKGIFGNSSGSHSNEATKFFVSLYKQLRRLGYSRKDMVFGIKGSKEMSLFDPNIHKRYSYDFTFIPKSVIIEYNGNMWHPRKSMMSEADYDSWSMPWHEGLTAIEKESKDLVKNKFAETSGYTVVEIWSSQSFSEKMNICLKALS
jgi:hypothetical protein